MCCRGGIVGSVQYCAVPCLDGGRDWNRLVAWSGPFAEGLRLDWRSSGRWNHIAALAHYAYPARTTS